MEHVDYVAWAEYIFTLLQEHHPETRSIHEFGCGTGSFALELLELGSYEYGASDFSEEMIAVASHKARDAGSEIDFCRIDFTRIPAIEQVDTALLLYDGINYVLELESVAHVLQGIYHTIKPGGVLIFDQSTPANSLNHKDGFDDSGQSEEFEYLRSSKYDPVTRHHITLFRLDIDGRMFTEKHVQRAYDLDEIRSVINESSFVIEASYDGFSLDNGHGESERIHWVLRRPSNE